MSQPYKYDKRTSQNQTLTHRLIRPILLFAMLMIVGTCGYYFLGNLTGQNFPLRKCFYLTSMILTGVGLDDVLGTYDSWTLTIFTATLMFTGLGIVLYAMSSVIAFIVGGELGMLLENRKMEKRIAKLKGHFIICGGGRTGENIAAEMMATGRKVVVIDIDEERVARLKMMPDLLCVRADASDDDVLIDIGIERAEGLVAALPNDKDNLLTVITARQINPGLRIITRCVDSENAGKLRKAGADGVVSPTSIGGLRMASELIRPSVTNFLDTLMRDRHAIRFEELVVPEAHELVGVTLAEAKFPSIANINVIATLDSGATEFEYNPRGQHELHAGMTIIAIGMPKEIEKLRGRLKL